METDVKGVFCFQEGSRHHGADPNPPTSLLVSMQIESLSIFLHRIHPTVFSWKVVPRLEARLAMALFSSVQCTRNMATAKASQSSFPSVISDISRSSRGCPDHSELSNQGSSVSPDKKPSTELKSSELTKSWPCLQFTALGSSATDALVGVDGWDPEI